MQMIARQWLWQNATVANRLLGSEGGIARPLSQRGSRAGRI